jgi:hypothetical protein
MFVPLMHAPLDIDEMESIVASGFREFNLPSPHVWFDQGASSSTMLKDGFVMIEGDIIENRCWVSISDCYEESSAGDKYVALADVKTRGNWMFAATVAYSLCKFAGHVVFNDAGELDGQETYSAESLKKLLAEWSSKNSR